MTNSKPEKRPCSVPDCVSTRGLELRKGMCAMHYQRNVRHGDPLTSLRRSYAEILLRDGQGRKRCKTCDAWRPESEYSSVPARTDGLNTSCKECLWAQGIRIRYGVSPERYGEMLKAQNYGCANRACRATAPGGKGKRWSIDHDHACCPGSKSCGECVRGLLCSACNIALGHARDSAEVLAGLMAYLKDFCYAVGGVNADQIRKPWESHDEFEKRSAA